MDAIGLLENYKGTLIHGRLGSYFSYSCDYDLCNAHVSRELNYVEERFGANWAAQLKALLIKARIQGITNFLYPKNPLYLV